MTDHRYVVLTEAEDRHYVAVVRREGTPNWAQIVAIFADKERAECYAQVENDLDDDPVLRRDDIQGPPDLTAPQTGLTKINGFKPTPEPPKIEAPAPEVETLADEILNALPALIKEFPKGPTTKQVAKRLGVEDHYARRAMIDLDRDGRATLDRRKDSSAYHLTPFGYDAPPPDLTRAQQDVFNVLCQAASGDGWVRLSNREICERAGCSRGGIKAVLDALRHKGKLELGQSGVGPRTSQYRVIRDDYLVTVQ